MEGYAERSSTDVDVAILAGGLGTRLSSVILERPKVLAQVLGRPFLSYLLDQVYEADLRRVILATGHRSELVLEELGTWHRGVVGLIHSREDRPLGTAGALRKALPNLRTEWLLVMNGDSLCRVGLSDIVSTAVADGNPTMAVVKVPDVSRYGSVRYGADGFVTDFHEKGLSEGPGWINAGLYVIRRTTIATIADDRPVSFEREILPRLVSEGLKAFPTAGPFIDIGTPESYADAERFFTQLSEGSS